MNERDRPRMTAVKWRRMRAARPMGWFWRLRRRQYRRPALPGRQLRCATPTRQHHLAPGSGQLPAGQRRDVHCRRSSAWPLPRLDRLPCWIVKAQVGQCEETVGGGERPDEKGCDLRGRRVIAPMPASVRGMRSGT
ncbi:hypothetical protein HD597_000646 [Nonomuraea thailandensis]|uniref:Uncharacterized protein n=1 Tax=Nonomuraea thailandensis TaxID=1188745 RepID=A0A9X2GE04_9ACTN|nr:hypothetical protein [Nonomuraea thailandensis]